MMEPKGFRIELKTVESTALGQAASDVTVTEFCDRIKGIMKQFSVTGSNQRVALTIHTCDSSYEVEDSVINLVPEITAPRSEGDYQRNYWIEN